MLSSQDSATSSNETFRYTFAGLGGFVSTRGHQWHRVRVRGRTKRQLPKVQLAFAEIQLWFSGHAHAQKWGREGQRLDDKAPGRVDQLDLLRDIFKTGLHRQSRVKWEKGKALPETGGIYGRTRQSQPSYFICGAQSSRRHVTERDVLGVKPGRHVQVFLVLSCFGRLSVGYDSKIKRHSGD